MIISSKGKYAMMLMLDLATYYQGDPVKVKDIAKREDISDKYLEQIIAILNKAGLVKSIRGAKGGYKLSKKPEDYNVGTILRTVEGSLSVTDYDTDDNRENLNYQVCTMVYSKLDKTIDDFLDNLTLDQLQDYRSSLAGDFYSI